MNSETLLTHDDASEIEIRFVITMNTYTYTLVVIHYNAQNNEIMTHHEY